MTAPLSTVLVRCFYRGVPGGLAIGCLTYGGIGYWIAGTTGLCAGLVIAILFAIAGTIIGVRYLKAFNALEQQMASAQDALR